MLSKLGCGMVDSGPFHKSASGFGVVVRVTTVTQQKEDRRNAYPLFGGGWWIRTTEVSDNRFTVCPLWPLGKSPILELVNGVEPSTC